MKKPVSHTPGPWRRDHVEIYGANDKHVVWELGNNNDADANLIVAAPDLLYFVKQMHAKHAPSGSRQRCLSCGLDGNCCGTYLAADALIAKVEGR